MILYTSPRSGTWSASTAAAGYAAAQAADSAVSKPWRSTTNSASWVQVDLGSALTVAAVAISETNASGISVQYGATSTPSTNLGAINTAADGQGRRKGVLAAAISARYWRFNFSGTPTDGAAYWSAGSVWLFATATTLPDPVYPATIDYSRGQDLATLPNGREIAVARGISRARVQLGWRVGPSQDIEQLARLARAGAAWLALGISGEPAMTWPVIFTGPSIVRRKDGFNRERVDLDLLELA